jgi:hypothetical protein
MAARTAIRALLMTEAAIASLQSAIPVSKSAAIATMRSVSASGSVERRVRVIMLGNHG